MKRIRLVVCVTFAAVLIAAFAVASPGAEDPVFSGPQVGERLAAFKVRSVLGDAAGDEVDLVADAAGKPLVIIFVHELTRPSVGLTRIVMDYAKQREKDGLQAGIVFLAQDLTEIEAAVKRASHALPRGIPVGISPDGLEGPGAYGLNRKVMLTVLVAKDNRVTANFALVQPSVAADAPEIGHAIIQALGGGEKPTLREMGGDRAAMMERPARGGADDTTFRALLAPVIRKTATDDDVAEAANRVEEKAAQDEAFQRRVGEVAARIIAADKLENYGTPAAQELLRKWAKEFAPRGEDGQRERRADEKDGTQQDAGAEKEGAKTN